MSYQHEVEFFQQRPPPAPNILDSKPGAGQLLQHKTEEPAGVSKATATETNRISLTF